MSELSFDISCDWGLQAIVKEAKTKVINNIMEIPPSYAWVEDYYKNQENATLLLNELHQICTPNHHQNIISNTSSPTILLGDKSIGCPINEPKQNMKNVSHTKNLEIAPKRRRSKFKQTLVHQSTCDRILSDKWNWRKYGEKVIKGSPYPRSYYRCSNSGGCVARKQVEQSLSDPKKFVITYIDEHTHPYPTRRPSQAGRNSRRSSNNRSINNVSSELNVGVEDDDTSLECVEENSTSSSSNNNIVFGDDFLLGLEGFDLDVLCDLQW